MSTSVLVRGTLHQRHSHVPTNDATSSHRLHSIEREFIFYLKNISALSLTSVLFSRHVQLWLFKFNHADLGHAAHAELGHWGKGA